MTDFRDKARKAVVAFAIVSGMTVGGAGIVGAQDTVINAPVQEDADTAVQEGDQTQVGANDNDANNEGDNVSVTDQDQNAEQEQTGGDQTNGDDTASVENEISSDASTNVGGGDGKSKAGDSAAYSEASENNQAGVVNANDSNEQTNVQVADQDQSANTEQGIVLDNDAANDQDAELVQVADQGAEQGGNQEAELGLSGEEVAAIIAAIALIVAAAGA